MRKRKVTYLLFALAVLLLLGSTVGSTRAALTYYSENYVAKITVDQIGVSLLENGEAVSSRDYDDDEWRVRTNKGSDATSGELLKNMLAENEKLALNKKYTEKLTVKNSGTIDEYVRVRIYKYWMKDGKKVTTLSPDLIDLNLVNKSRWVKNPNETAECTELFYKVNFLSGKESESFAYYPH